VCRGRPQTATSRLFYDGAMALVIGVEPPDGRDAGWRPAARASELRLSASPGDDTPRRPRPPFASIRIGTSGDPASPWSRDAIEAPLPTIAEVRDRWRAELAETPVVEPPAPPVVTPRRAISVPGQPPSSTTGGVLFTGLAVAIFVTVSLSLAWAIRPPVEAAPVDVLPAASLLRGSAPLDAGAREGSFAADASSAATVGDGELTVRDVADGAVRWHREVPITGDHAVGVFGDVVLHVWGANSSGEATEVAGYDALDGSRRWGAAFDGDMLLLDGAILEYAWTDDVPVVHVIDPATGSEIGPAVRAVKMRQPEGFVIGRAAGGLVALATDTGRVASTVVPALEVAGVAPVGRRTVTFTESADVVLYGHGGDVLDSRRFESDAIGDFRGRAELVGAVPGTSLVIVASGSSVGLDVGTGRIVQRWEVPGRVGTPVDTELGPLAAARIVDPATGQVDTAIIDLLDGATVVVTDEGTTRTGDPLVARDGYVAAPEVGDPTPELVGVGFDGAQQWSLAADDVAWYRLIDGTLYVLHRDGHLTAHR